MKETTLIKQLRRQPSFEKRLIRESTNLAKCKSILQRNGIEELIPQEVILKAIETHGDNLTLGWSGGECSTVCLHMALQIKRDIKVIFNNTGVEFPENVKYVYDVAEQWNLNLTTIKPKASFFHIVKEHGFPKLRIPDWKRKRGKWNKTDDRRPLCCYLLKEKERYLFYREHGITGDIVGLRASESRLRTFHIGRYGQIYHVKDLGKKNRPALIYYVPIALWTIKQVSNYLRENEIPVNEIYSKGRVRTGCMPCTGFLNWEKYLAKENPKMYRYIQGLRGVRLMDDWLTFEDKRLNGCDQTPAKIQKLLEE